MIEDYTDSSYWFAFYQNELLVKKIDESIELLTYSDFKKLNLESARIYNSGLLKGQIYYSTFLKEKPKLEGVHFYSLRALLPVIDEVTFRAVGRAFQIINWDETHLFCGKCGAPTELKKDELAKICTSCSLIVYPRISPAVIVAVTKDDKILLAHSGRFKRKMYSVLAGFVEPGETFEECIVREIKEEVNIEVHNIKYFGSQPWPFPDSIMIGFTAEYKSGEIKVDGKEIFEAEWFDVKNLPESPGTWSIARKLIDWFVDQKSEVKGQKSEIGSQKSEIRSQKSKIGDQKSEVKDRRSENHYNRFDRDGLLSISI